ncbi:MAG: DUF1992 domain-containing protein [Candidatus Latescibacteria bacterium]|nr:DUF1992 domain-containing protein [Candidatus Latescibacterota bacterium]
MFGLEKAVEDKIRQAMAEGKFDNLPGKGKPVDLEAYFQTPEYLRMAYSVLKSADFVPQEVQLLKEIEALREQLAACADEKERGRLTKAINDKTLRVKIGMESLNARKGYDP